MTVRRELEEREELVLCRFATKSAASRGRQQPEEECSLRPAFQHDRDRILYCKAFRRLKHKTQVFLAPTGDHYRTRLTHTLEVSQIARTVARALKFNEDLTEAIALGHDLGHTPFGHAGESVLNSLVPGGFQHHRQSLRVVDRLEKDGAGLNLTHEVRMGILQHTKGRGSFLSRRPADGNTTMEAKVVRISDIIAYIAHDTEDAIRAKVISSADLPGGVKEVLGPKLSRQIDTMVRDLISRTLATGGEHLDMSPRVEEAMVALREFLYARVYENPEVHEDFIKASKVVTDLYERLLGDDAFWQSQLGPAPPDEARPRRAADYLAGMTDRYCLHIYQSYLLPSPWGRL